MKNGVIECNVCHSKLVPSSTACAILREYDRHQSKMSSKSGALTVLLVVGDCILIDLQQIMVYMFNVDGKFNFSLVTSQRQQKFYFPLLCSCSRPKDKR